MSGTQQPEALRFTKKPVTIVASQWFKSGDHPAVRDISDSDDLFFTGMGGATLIEREKFGVIGTLESPSHLVTPGDWIITGVRGEHYPCKPDFFEETYAPKTAPVALPKPVGWFHHHPKECKNGKVYNYQIASGDRKDGWEESPVYTEQQVHALLAEVSAPAAQEMDAQLVAFIENVRDFKAQAVRVGTKEGEIRWDIEFGHYGAELRGKTLREAISKALAAQAKQGGAA